jgi:hypothetical protein
MRLTFPGADDLLVKAFRPFAGNFLNDEVGSGAV